VDVAEGEADHPGCTIMMRDSDYISPWRREDWAETPPSWPESCGNLRM